MAFHGSETTATRPLHGSFATDAAEIAIEGGRIVTPTGTIEGGTIILEGDRIDRVRSDTAPQADRVVDATDRIIMPGIVDLHGDDFEHQLVPRSGAMMDPHTAFIASDRLNVTHGITTKAHAIAFEGEQADHRSVDGASRLIDSLEETTELLGTNLVHARFELTGVDEDVAREVMADDSVVLASLMHHAPGEGQYDEADAFHDRYGVDAGLRSDTVDDLARIRVEADDVWTDTAATIVDAALTEGIPIASHDDDSSAAVHRADALGIDVSEFPLTLEAATRAGAVGMTTVMGAPNLVRGESLFDNLTTSRAIEADVLDVLCADYHPPSLLQSVFVDTDEPLHKRVARVTDAPARVLGLADRGRLTAGARADILVVEPDPVPRPTDVIVGGRRVMSNDPERSG